MNKSYKIAAAVHDKFVILVKCSCHFPKLPIDDVIVVARLTKARLGKLT